MKKGAISYLEKYFDYRFPLKPEDYLLIKGKTLFPTFSAISRKFFLKNKKIAYFVPVLQVCLLLRPRLLLGDAHDGEVGDDLLGVLSLAGAGLAAVWRKIYIYIYIKKYVFFMDFFGSLRDQHGLILGVVHHLKIEEEQTYENN